MIRWNSPDDIVKAVDVRSLSNEDLDYYHDQMHIFWAKIEDGFYFGDSELGRQGWTFKEVYLIHKLVVIEMLRRDIDHIHPINNLDHLELIHGVKELVEVVNDIKSSRYVGTKAIQPELYIGTIPNIESN